MPDLDAMRRDIVSMGVTNAEHYETMRDVYDRFGVVLDPHGAVGWKALDIYLKGKHDRPAVIYETADPGKFPDDVERALGRIPPLPLGMVKQLSLEERVYSITSPPRETAHGPGLSDLQVQEARQKIAAIFS